MLRRAIIWLQIRRDSIFRRLDSMIFDWRLARAVKKYGGGENIPPEVIGKLLGNVGDDMTLKLSLYTGRVCTKLGLDVAETNFVARLSWLFDSKITPTIDERIYGYGVLEDFASADATMSYSIALRELLANNDTSYAKMREHFPTHAEYTEFMKLCGRE